MTSPDDDLALAQRLADAADAVTRPHVGRATEAEAKADGSPLTPIDLEVERTLVGLVEHARPRDGFLGEEVGDARFGSRRWIVDGIDGTASFSLGRAEWATLIALEVDGQITLGIASAPALQCRWWAARGRGAWRMDGSGPTRLHVSNNKHGALRVESWVSPWSARPEDAPMFARLAEMYPGGGVLPWATPRPPGQRPSWGSGHPGGGLLVAAGMLDGYVMAGGGPWDYAAPSIIVEEAGGVYSDLRGRHDITSASAVFSNGRFHGEILTALAG